MLEVRALPGTHELVVDLARRYATPPGLALDLGAGSGALAERLQAFGFDVWTVDIADGPKGKLRFIQLDLNDSRFHLKLPVDFDFITAVEVIEHLESPLAFLANVRCLLKKEGTAVITTPNVENLPARLKFLLRGRIRAADERAPEHITPIFYDLFVRQYLSRVGLRLIEHFSSSLG